MLIARVRAAKIPFQPSQTKTKNSQALLEFRYYYSETGHQRDNYIYPGCTLWREFKVINEHGVTHPSLRTMVESTGRPCALLGEEIISKN